MLLPYRDLNTLQARNYLDAASLLEALRDARRELRRDYAGGMHYKTINGKEYLYKTHDRKGNATSLGPRSDDNDRKLSQFVRHKHTLVQRIADLKQAYETQCRMNAAVRLGSVPNQVADVIEQLDDAELLDHSLIVIGTNAMHAYEALAGVRFDSGLMATLDVDLLWNHHTKLSLGATAAVKTEGLLGLLKKADKTFQIDPRNSFRARSSKGFMVDLIRQMPDPPWADEPDRFFESDLVATDIRNMTWMLNAPHIHVPAIAMDGRCLMMNVPDPRAFTLFKVWLSRQDDREPTKKLRDIEQARAVARLIQDKLPQYDRWGSLHSFPNEVMNLAAEQLEPVRESLHRRQRG